MLLMKVNLLEVNILFRERDGESYQISIRNNSFLRP